MEMPLTIIAPEQFISVYSQGYFPMADEEGNLEWYEAIRRAVFPLDKMKEPRSLRQTIRKKGFTFTINQDFEFVIRSCAARESTWISESIIQTYIGLHKYGVAHSIETNYEGKIVGGLYGISLGACFFGESMFNSESDAAKAAFYFLVSHLKERNYEILDGQFINPFTKKLGAIEVPAEEFELMLSKALKKQCIFD